VPGASAGGESEAGSVQSVAQGVLLDFVGSVQILRLWSLHNSIKDALDGGAAGGVQEPGEGPGGLLEAHRQRYAPLAMPVACLG